MILVTRYVVLQKKHSVNASLDLRGTGGKYVKQSNDRSLIAGYNGAVEALAHFRSEHVILVTRYVVLQKKHSVNASLDLRGTGGTPFMSFLKQVRDDTLALRLQTQ